MPKRRASTAQNLGLGKIFLTENLKKPKNVKKMIFFNIFVYFVKSHSAENTESGYICSQNALFQLKLEEGI